MTGRGVIVSVANRNALLVERHMELLNLNDEEHIYLEGIKDNSKNLYQKYLESVFWDIYVDILILIGEFCDKIDLITDDWLWR